ncbi:MAG: HEAT repeat domain-containing protein [Calothrix sp. FI2-JRJ7]|jgi:HEAT repeat protein|nr:HEAT repeat domain-containing protein [Calothrix sp. FI2-JRJ7]
MSPLTDALNRIETWIVRNDPKFALGLQPGLTRAEINEIVKDFQFQLTQELYEFYEWHNGCNSFGYIIPFYDNFFPLKEVLTNYQSWLSWERWNPHWLPILDGNGDYRYAITVGEETAPVWHIDPECGIEEIRWDNLTDLFLAAAECYETGAYYIDEEGYLKEDEQRVIKIQRKYNYRGTEQVTSNQAYDPYPPTVASQINVSEPDALEQLTQALNADPLNSDARIQQVMAANTLENLANSGLFEEAGAQPLVIALQNMIHDGAGHALAAKKLGELGDKRAIEPLLQALNHNSSEVRVNAIDALTKLGDVRVVDQIIQCLQDSDFFVRVAAARALAQLKDIKAIEPLIEALKIENQSTACGAIAEALGDFADARAIEPLIEILHSQGRNLRDAFSFQRVRVCLIEALSKIEDDRTTNALLEVLTAREDILQANRSYWQESYQTIEIAVKTFLRRKHPQLISILTQLLQDSERRIRCDTLSALTKIPDVMVVDMLILALSDEDALLRKAAVRSLGERQDVKSIEPLIGTLQDINVRVRMEAVQALEKINDERVVDALLQVLNDENPNVRACVVLALGNLRNPKAIEALNRCLQDNSSIVSKMAQEALNKFA